jgi:MoaA/NifB/PqqE/SkfB family radical SAM enzyme
MNMSSSHLSKTRGPGGVPELPRIIIWQIAPGADTPAASPAAGEATRHAEPLNTSECMLVIDSIARTSKPIVVLTGDRILDHYPRLLEILEYGRALGLKMIVEVEPRELNDQVLTAYAHFGERIFRVKVSEAIRDNEDTRIESSPFFAELEECLDRLERSGYETHLVYTATGPDIRILALIHDYAVRRSARGLYCHLRFDLGNGGRPRDGRPVDEFIRRFATMKEYSPASMIISPQCVKFVHQSPRYGDAAQAGGGRGQWEYTCLAGKSYAFIDPTGRVQLCGGNPEKRSTLRDVGYDFRKIWTHSPSFVGSRKICRNCLHGYHSLRPVQENEAGELAPSPGQEPVSDAS